MSPAAWGPTRTRRARALQRRQTRGGGSRHSCRGRAVLHVLARASGAPLGRVWGPAEHAGMGVLAPPVQEGEFRPAGAAVGVRRPLPPHAGVSRHAARAGCGGTSRGWWDLPRAQEGRARALQRWQDGFSSRACWWTLRQHESEARSARRGKGARPALARRSAGDAGG